jgi:hypothetical protein
MISINFGYKNNDGSVNAAAFGQRGQAYLASGDNSHGTGNGTVENGVKRANHYCDALHHKDSYVASPFNKAEANEIQSQENLRQFALGK